MNSENAQAIGQGEALIVNACGALATICRVWDSGTVASLERREDGETVVYRFHDKLLTLSDARKAARALTWKELGAPDAMPAIRAAIVPLAALCEDVDVCEDDDVIVADCFDDPVITVAHIRAAARGRALLGNSLPQQ